ncbi:MAG TPA: hypothetical protein VF881_19320 [Polyangiaceae bacterium]
MRHASVVAALLTINLLLGCNAILGIEEGSPRSDGGTDALPPAGPPLTCAWVFPSHRTVADLSANTGGTRLFGSNLVATHVPGNPIFRVAAFHDPPLGPFELYTIDASPSSMLFPPQSVGSNGVPVQMLRLDNSTIGIVVVGLPMAGTSPEILLYRVDDADRLGSASQGAPLIDASTLGNLSEVSALMDVGPSGESLVLSYRASPNEYRVSLGQRVGGAAGTLFDLTSDFVEPNIRQRAVLTVGGRTHVFVGLPGSPAGGRQFSLDFGSTTAPPPRPISNMTTFLLATGISPFGKINVAAVDLGLGVALMTGQLDATQIETFQASDFPVATMFGGLTSVPYASAPGWIGDNLVSLGHTGPAADELTIVWADPFGHMRVQQKIDQAPAGTKIGASVFTAAAQLGILGGILNVVWAVTLIAPDGGEPYDVLYYDQIRCL